MLVGNFNFISDLNLESVGGEWQKIQAGLLDVKADG